ncbi:3-O-alpha-D-mannopyranosyl-alpha-D-mannopyranose xylosylphosphotransferase [Microdochium nivale]|nr:3-O-alpha-D-mannopyranosyl-alpha-D-mannopyranose xylosylphosphotransferase [Microdochium nivale]
MYSHHTLGPSSSRSRSPIIPRSWIRHQKAYLMGGVAIFVLWQTFLSSRSQLSYPQWKDSYAIQQAAPAPVGMRNQLPLQSLHEDQKFGVEAGAGTGAVAQGGGEQQDPGGAQDVSVLVSEGDDIGTEQHTGDDAYEEGNFDSVLKDDGEKSWNPDGSLYEFPPHEGWMELDARAETMPDLVHVPFEDAVAGETLDGWEDEWFGNATYSNATWGTLPEPRVDFIYTWVNGSQDAFARTMRPYELNSTLNDAEGTWLKGHGSNRYRSWDELRYSVRSVEKYASGFTNKIQFLVNAVDESADPAIRRYTKQRPLWLSEEAERDGLIETLSQEDFFGEEELAALPSFNSLSIESQLYNTPSNVDRFFALSDDMLLGKPHAAADIYSPLFGPAMGFKSNGYNTRTPPGEVDAHRFGEKPYLIYTSWMLNRRFGVRKRKGQVHFGHSMSRSIASEVRDSFPRPSLRSVCQRFRGETGFQLYTWYAAFHYTVERHREALLYSYIMLRSDVDGDGHLGWPERAQMMRDLEEGMAQEGNDAFRRRMYYKVAEHHREAGLEPPRVNVDVKWTSLDGPMMIRDIDCSEFDVNECLAPGFSSPVADAKHVSPVFASATIFDRVTRQDPICGDCMLKLLLNRQPAGLEPLLPPRETMQAQRDLILKAVKRYQYSVVEPDALFVMITDAEQVQATLVDRFLGGDPAARRDVGQLCLNDDVVSSDEGDLAKLQSAMVSLFTGLLPEPSRFENDAEQWAAATSDRAITDADPAHLLQEDEDEEYEEDEEAEAEEEAEEEAQALPEFVLPNAAAVDEYYEAQSGEENEQVEEQEQK